MATNKGFEKTNKPDHIMTAEIPTEKTGSLLKKSSGLWKRWQRRQCSVKEGLFTISCAASNEEPVRIHLPGETQFQGQQML